MPGTARFKFPSRSATIDWGEQHGIIACIAQHDLATRRFDTALGLHNVVPRLCHLVVRMASEVVNTSWAQNVRLALDIKPFTEYRWTLMR